MTQRTRIECLCWPYAIRELCHCSPKERFSIQQASLLIYPPVWPAQGALWQVTAGLLASSGSQALELDPVLDREHWPTNPHSKDMQHQKKESDSLRAGEQGLVKSLQGRGRTKVKTESPRTLHNVAHVLLSPRRILTLTIIG